MVPSQLIDASALGGPHGRGPRPRARSAKPAARPRVSWLHALAALAALTAAGGASAAEITYLSVRGLWHSPVDTEPGTQPGDPAITNGNPTSSISWGTTSGSQSGYDFMATMPPPFSLPGPIPFFSLGTFQHRNFEVDDPWLTSVQLDVILELAVDGVPMEPLTFTFTFNHEETPNNPTPPATCPYPTPPGDGCTDRVTIVSSAEPTTFFVDGVEYTLSMSFLNDGNPVSEFITEEGGTINSSGLVGEFTLPPIPPGTPILNLDKTGPVTMNPGEWSEFGIDVVNAGVADAHDVTLVDRLPYGPNGGMCDVPPEILSAQVYATDGVTPVPGKGPLAAGTDFSVAFDGVSCELMLRTLSADAVIGIGERLKIVYRTQLDANTRNAVMLTNVAAAVEWFNGPASDPMRLAYTRELTDGTVDTVDHEDAHTVVVMPRLYAEKAAALEVDAMSPGIVDPGDVLRYTIRVHNFGQLPITEVVLRDSVPANTTYVADSLTLNGLPVGQPDGGVSPLVAGIDLSSAGLTPPLPGPGAGTLAGGEMAVVQFDLRVNDGVPPGTVIANQAVVTSAEVPSRLTDGDGNPATGPEPTVVVVGNLQELRITKGVAVVGGGPALAGSTLEYTILVQNVGIVPAYEVMIRDDIAMPMPGYLAFVDGSWSMNGSADGITVVDSLLTADYSATYGALQPGRDITLRFQATLDANLPVGTRVTNTATVYWNDPVQTASATVAIDVGGIPGVGLMSGRVWHDSDFDRTPDEDELYLEGWIVELFLNGDLAHAATTAADGTYRLSGIEPNYETTDTYELRFRRPGATETTALLGRADSEFTNDLQRISDIVVISGSNLQDLNLPIDPNGVVYGSLSRTPLAGATLTLLDAASGAAVPAACFYDEAQQDQVTLADGYYKFDLAFSSPECSSGSSYLIRVTPPSSAYIQRPSELIPPATTAATPPFVVPTCAGSLDDAVPATANHCEAAPTVLAPPSSVPPGAAGTLYHLHLVLDDSLVPGSSQIFNNHIPLDLDLDQSVIVTKTTPAVNVSRGQLVPYTITLVNGVGVNIPDVAVVDRPPPGFRYVAGSARVDGVPAEPRMLGSDLYWDGLSVTADNHHEIVMLLAVGSGVGEGEFVNRAQALHAVTGTALSSEATATVRIVADPTFDCTDVLGKVYDDANRNGVQDSGEPGIAGVRLATARGLVATTDRYGRYHIACAITPREGRGTNFVLKLDDRTLPTGFRAASNVVQVQRATRGKALEVNFAASIHRVVGLDVSDPVFEPGAVEMRALWRPRIALLVEELRHAPATLRLSYLADLEEPALVAKRVAWLKAEIDNAWRATDGCCAYELAIESEIFWRRGEPAEPARERRRLRNGGER